MMHAAPAREASAFSGADFARFLAELSRFTSAEEERKKKEKEEEEAKKTKQVHEFWFKWTFHVPEKEKDDVSQAEKERATEEITKFTSPAMNQEMARNVLPGWKAGSKGLSH